MAITTRAFGTTQDGQNVTMYTLTNQSGTRILVTIAPRSSMDTDAPDWFVKVYIVTF